MRKKKRRNKNKYEEGTKNEINKQRKGNASRKVGLHPSYSLTCSKFIKYIVFHIVINQEISQRFGNLMSAQKLPTTV
jgi:hypothetical protein